MNKCGKFGDKSLVLSRSHTKKGDNQREKGEKIKEFLGQQGIEVYKIDVAKARDGMERGHFFVEFHFRKGYFKVLDLEVMRDRKLKDDPK